MRREEIATLICARLSALQNHAAEQFSTSAPAIGHCIIDDLLPPDLALAIGSAFPCKEAMTAKRSMRERKAIMASTARCDPLVGEAIYAFHEPSVVALIAEITVMPSVMPDPFLYAGGISAMGDGDFLNPHLDNSHDKDRNRWRALNLLFYVTPDWPDDGGGDLELWPDGATGRCEPIHSRFNRLIVMATHGQSWHSVSRVNAPGIRRCVSNYFFTPQATRPTDRFHVTSFRGRPDQPIADMALRADALARNAIRHPRPGGIAKVTHLNAAHQFNSPKMLNEKSRLV